jgi:hypothetical protein
VLTRLPGPARRTPDVVLRLLAANVPENRHLSANGGAELVGRPARENLAGGAVYDALVGAAAADTTWSSPRGTVGPSRPAGPWACRPSSCRDGDRLPHRPLEPGRPRRRRGAGPMAAAALRVLAVGREGADARGVIGDEVVI